jgi:sugar lactone lactonase YvrE
VFAGVGGGPGDRNASGSQARFAGPLGLALSATTLYVTDSVTNTIRLYDLQSGAVTTLAGSPGDAGYLNGLISTFDSPSALALDDDAGILYVADSVSCAIRSIDLGTSTVSTIAGKPPTCGNADGVGSAAQFDKPQGLALGSAGLFVADTGNDTLRWITLDGGIGTVLTIAGQVGVSAEHDGVGTAATFASPRGLAVDGLGSLYVADFDAGAIRQMVLDGGAVSTLLSGQVTVSSGLTGPTALAYAGARGTLFVAGNDAIWFTDGGLLQTVAGTPGSPGSSDSLGQFSSPGGLLNVVGSGALLLADTGNDTLRQVSLADSGVTTLAGTAPHPGTEDGASALATFDAPGSIANDGTNLYIADTGSNTIRQITLAGGVVSTLAGVAFQSGSRDGPGAQALFKHPSGLAYDSAGNLFVSDTGNNTIREIVLDGGTVSTVAGTAGDAGNLNGPALSATFNGPLGLAVSVAPGAGALYVADSMNSSVREITYSAGQLGTVSTLVRQDTDPGNPLDRPAGLVLADGYLFMSDTGSNTVCVIFSGGINVLVGTPYVAGWEDSANVTLSAPTTLLSHPRDIAFIPPSYFYIADWGNSAVRLLTFDIATFLTGATGSLTTLIGTPGQSGVLQGLLPAGLNGPSGLAYTPTPIPTLFITDSVENLILQAQ